jgi:septum formation protein
MPPGILNLILASSSPRRRELLRRAGYSFEVSVPTLSEPQELSGNPSPVAYAEILAYYKARTIADQRPEACVIGADTIVVVNGRIVGKADGPDEARRILAELSSVRHAVLTGVALVGPGDHRLIASDTTYVTMRPMGADEIEKYIQSGEWIGKAGAYAIQETADRFVQRVDGSLSNVVGLPIELLSRMIAQVERTQAKAAK